MTVLSSNGGEFILSRRILGAMPGEIIDHKNRDTADCRRPNLRFCDASSNMGNTRRNLGKALPKGVLKKRNRYHANITHRGERLFLGSYGTVEAAAHAYAEVARALFGEFARAE